MTDQNYQPSKYSPIALGVILFILLLVVLCSLSDLIKFAGYPLLWLPEQLGFVEVVHPRDVTVIHMSEGRDHTVQFPKTGWYQVYTNDYDLLLATDDLAVRGGKPWISARDPSGSAAGIGYIQRGLRPYDSPFAKGRPVLTIYAGEPGQYSLRHPTKPTDLTITPDYTTGNEFTIYFFYILQLAVLSAPFAYLIYRSRTRTVQRVKSVKQLKRIQGDDFWKREIHRKQAGPDPKQPTYKSSDKWW